MEDVKLNLDQSYVMLLNSGFIWNSRNCSKYRLILYPEEMSNHYPNVKVYPLEKLGPNKAPIHLPPVKSRILIGVFRQCGAEVIYMKTPYMHDCFKVAILFYISRHKMQNNEGFVHLGILRSFTSVHDR